MRFSPFFFLLLLFSCGQETDSAAAVPDPPTDAEPTPALISAPDAAIPLAAFYYADSTLLLPEDSLSPQAHIEITTVVPHAPEEALNLIINKDLASLIARDEVPLEVSNLPQTLQSAAATTLYNYRRQGVDAEEVRAMPHAFMLELFYETEVLLNTDGLLSLATSHYSYSGGAHGLYYTELHSYSVQSASGLHLDKIFREGTTATLTDLITAEVDPDRLYVADEPVAPTENFALTPEGVLFDYPPYEIGPYASGEIEVLLPYSELKDLLTPEAQQLVLPLTGTNLQ